MKKALTALLVVGLLAGTGMAADWERENGWSLIEQPWPAVSPGSTVILSADVRNETDHQIDPSKCEDVTAFTIIDGERKPMEPPLVNDNLPDNNYIAVRQSPADTSTPIINVTISGSGCPGFKDGNASEETEWPFYNNISVDIVNDTTSRDFVEENTYRFWVEATTPQGEAEDTTQMAWSAFNHSIYMSPLISPSDSMWGEMTYENGFYKGDVTIPSGSDRVILSFTAEGTNKGYVNATGGEGVLIDVSENLQGGLWVEAQSSGCRENITACEKGANLTLLFNETSSQADDVRFRVSVGNKEIASLSGERVRSNMWQSSRLTIPEDLDTSELSNRMEIAATASNSLGNYTASKTVDLQTLGLSASTSTKRIVPGQDIELQTYPEKQYSKTLYPLDRIQSIDITVQGPSGSSVHTVSLTGDDLSRYKTVTGTGFLYPFQLPGDASTGSYVFTSDAASIYNEQATAQSSFKVVNPAQACEESIGNLCIESDARNITYTEAGIQQLQIPVQSLSRSPIDVSYTVKGSLQQLLGSGTATVMPAATAINLSLRTSRAINGNYTGNITLQTGNDAITIPATVSVKVPKELYEIRLKNAPDSVVSGESISFSLVIDNTGNTTIKAVTAAVDGLGIEKSVENGIPLPSGGTITATIEGTVSLSPGSYTGNQSLTVTTVTAKGNERTAKLSFTVVEDITDNIRSLASDTRSLEDRVQEETGSMPSGAASSIRSSMEQFEDTVREAQRAWERGDYDTARQRYQEAQSMKQEVESQLANPQPPETSEQETGDGGFSLDVSGTAVLAFLATLIVILAPIIYFAFFQERK